MGWHERIIQTLLCIFLPVTTPVLLPDDHYKLRYDIAIRRIVRPVMHRVLVLLRPNNGKTIKELLFDLSGFSQTKYKKTFDDKQRHKLDNNEPSESFDVSFIYALLQLVCGLADTNDSKWRTPGTLENSLKQLKNHRNTNAHEDVSFTCTVLQENIKDIEELCKNVLLEAGQISGQSVTSDITDMKRATDEILLGGGDWEPYKQARLKKRREHSSVLTREGRQDILRLGKNLRILNPFSWLLDSSYSHLDVEHIFTELLIEGNVKVEMQHLMTTRLSSGDLPDVIVISGPPGIGKTSLFRFLVHDWLSPHPTMLGMENTELVIPVELRYVSSHNVRDLLRDELLHNVSQQLEADDVMSALQNVCLLWILDGYDEANVDTRVVIKEILKKFPKSRVVITTRTEFKRELEIKISQLHRTFIAFSIEGFSKSNIEEYARKLIAVSVTDAGEQSFKLLDFMDFCQKDNRMGYEIFHVPLYMSVIIVLWLNDPDTVSLIKSSTALYCLLTDHIIQKLIGRESFVKLNQRRSFLESQVNLFVDYLGCVMWKKIHDCHYTLQKYEVEYLEKKCLHLGLPFTDTMSAFFLCAERATPTGVREEFTFIHRTVADFLSARAFANKMHAESWDIMTTLMYFFRSRWYVLLHHEPKHPHIRDIVDMDNLSKDRPDDIFQRAWDKSFSFPTQTFFDRRSYCELHDSVFPTTEDNIWCFAQSRVGGPWTIFLLGYLGVKNLFNKQRREQLVFIFARKRSFGLDFGMFPLLLQEASDHLFTKMFCIYVKNLTWSFELDFHFSEGMKFLQYVVPKSVFLHYCYGDSRDSSKALLEAIKTFMRHPVDIHLDLHYYFSRDDKDLKFTKFCLELLLNESSSCQLVTVRCPVDNDVVRILKKAVHIQELKIKFCGNDLPQLIELIKTLPKLKDFEVMLSPSSYVQSGHNSFTVEGQPMPKMSILLSDVFCLDPCVVGSSLKKLCFSPYHVVLQGRIFHVELDHILALVFWVLRSNKQVQKLWIVIDIGDRVYLYHELLHKLRIFYPFVKKEFLSCDIMFKYCHHGFMYNMIFGRGGRHICTTGYLDR